MCVNRWVETVSVGLGRRGDKRYHEVRYEHLLEDGEQVLRQLFDLLEEPWSDKVLQYYQQDDASYTDTKNPLHPGIRQPLNKKSVQRWQRDLTQADARVIQDMAGSLLKELGYIQDDSWISQCTRKSDSQ